jgi:hypothetical protein
MRVILELPDSKDKLLQKVIQQFLMFQRGHKMSHDDDEMMDEEELTLEDALRTQWGGKGFKGMRSRTFGSNY